MEGSAVIAAWNRRQYAFTNLATGRKGASRGEVVGLNLLQDVVPAAFARQQGKPGGEQWRLPARQLRVKWTAEEHMTEHIVKSPSPPRLTGRLVCPPPPPMARALLCGCDLFEKV